MGSSEERLFGDLVRDYRNKLNLSQEELADRAGLNPHSVSNLERGSTQVPWRSTANALADALELTGDVREAFIAARGRTTPRIPLSRSTPLRRPEAPPLVGRQAEQELIRKLLVESGPPFLLLVGEPGIGKTRLLTEAEEQGLASRWVVLRGEARRDEGQHPFAPISQALGRRLAALTPAQRRQSLKGFERLLDLFPELADQHATPAPASQAMPDQQRTQMFGIVASYLAQLARSSGVLLILDDMQWATPDALRLLNSLLRSSEIQSSWGLCVVAAARDARHPASPMLRTLQSELAHDHLLTLAELGPLSRADAEQLVENALAETPDLSPDERRSLVARFVERAGGVPFFLSSLANDYRPHPLADPTPTNGERIPRDIAEIVHLRISALPAVARDLLTLTAVYGSAISLATLRQISGIAEADLVNALEAARDDQLLIEQDDGAWAFRHDLLHGGVLAELSAARRGLLHQRIADVLEAQPGEPLLEQLAYHYSHTSEVGKAIHYLERAGDKAQDMHASDAAAGYYREALRRLARLDQADAITARLHEKLGAALMCGGQYEAALAPLESAAQALSRAGDLDGAGRVTAQIGWAHARRGAPQEGMARMERSLALHLLAQMLPKTQSSLWQAHAITLFMLNRYTEQRESARRACDCARQAHDTVALAQSLRLEALALGLLGDIREALSVLDETIRLAQSVDDLDTYSGALSDAAAMRRARGELETSWRLSKLALEAGAPLGDPMRTAFFSSAHGVDDFLRGDWRTARQHIERAVVVANGIEPSWVSAYPLADLGTLNLAEGRIELGQQQLHKALAFAQRDHDLQAQRIIQAPLAEYDLLRGEPHSAIQRLEPLIDRAVASDKESVALLPLLCRAYVATRQIDRAQAELAACVRQATASDARLVLLDALLAKADIHRYSSEWERAEHALNQAIEQARAMGYPYAEARALSLLGGVRADRNDIVGAREALREALSIFKRLGERLYAPLAAERLQRLDAHGGSSGPIRFNRFV